MSNDFKILLHDEGYFILKTDKYIFHLDEKSHVEKIGKLISEYERLKRENNKLKEKEIDFLEKRYEEVSYFKIKIEGLERDIKELKSDKEEWRKSSKYWSKTHSELEKENEELKQENRLLKGKLHQLRIKCGKQEEEIECLSEETIEQFKKDLKDGKFIELTARPKVRNHPNDHIGWKND